MPLSVLASRKFLVIKGSFFHSSYRRTIRSRYETSATLETIQTSLRQIEFLLPTKGTLRVLKLLKIGITSWMITVRECQRRDHLMCFGLASAAIPGDRLIDYPQKVDFLLHKLINYCMCCNKIIIDGHCSQNNDQQFRKEEFFLNIYLQLNVFRFGTTCINSCDYWCCILRSLNY
jgi:hypothetical protein